MEYLRLLKIWRKSPAYVIENIFTFSEIVASISVASQAKSQHPRKGLELVTLKSDFDRPGHEDVPVKSYRFQKNQQKLEEMAQPLKQVLKQIQISSVKNIHDKYNFLLKKELSNNVGKK